MTTATATRAVYLTGAEGGLGRLVLKRLGASAGVGRILTDGAIRGKKAKQLKVPFANEKIVAELKREKVDIVVHLASTGKARDEAAFEKIVLGTMTLLGAAVEAGVGRFVLASSHTVYGAHYNNPNFILETRRIRHGGRHPTTRDSAEVEKHAHDFVRHFSDLQLTILRFSPIVGPTIDSPVMRYLGQDACPVLAGFDPLFQLLHEEDAADAVVAAVHSEASGPINVAPEGVVPIVKAVRFLKREALIVPWLPLKASEQILSALKRLPFDATFLRYGCCLDTTRMTEELGFRPKRTSSEALRALGQGS